ncbi:metallophosphoesterase [Pendulispora rubella]|uniref:Metallophosphoesterase n=1 Tax=Pendulispora rubella TaxID=2741070 RepID=A0ABZ2LK50_9BACT
MKEKNRIRVATIFATLISHIVFAAAVHDALAGTEERLRCVVSLLSAAAGVAFFSARIGAWIDDPRRHRYFVALIELPFLVHWNACALGLVPCALVFAIRMLGLDVPRLGSIPSPYISVYLIQLPIAAYGIFVRRRWIVVRELDVPIQGLDRRFDGYRIAHLSDLHIGNMTPSSWGSHWAARVNRSAPDIVVVTGDLIVGGSDFLEDAAEVIGALRASGGVFVSLGNHDYFGDAERLVSAVRHRGARVLRNEGMVLLRNGARLYLAGIDDTWTRRDNLALAMAGCPQGVPSVLLSHDPERFAEAERAGIPLTLSGHTHGGQVAVPFLKRHPSLLHLFHPFPSGIYRKGRSSLYVHPGLGTSGPPIRLGVAPAIVVHTLRTVEYPK